MCVMCVMCVQDVVWVVAEEEQLRLGWELGGYHGNMTYPARVDGESRLRVTRYTHTLTPSHPHSPSPPAAWALSSSCCSLRPLTSLLKRMPLQLTTLFSSIPHSVRLSSSEAGHRVQRSEVIGH